LERSRRVFDEHVRENNEKQREEEKHKILDENKKMIEAHHLVKQRERRAIEHEQ
jgi:hypothetical protein